jgi:hypothetical protein
MIEHECLKETIINQICHISIKENDLDKQKNEILFL